MFSDIDYCHPNPCRHGGTCVELNQAATCSCTEKFKGQRCQGNNTLRTPFYPGNFTPPPFKCALNEKMFICLMLFGLFFMNDKYVPYETLEKLHS